MAAFLVVALALGVPAAVLRALCLGNACRAEATAASDTPFCSLPEETRRLITNGFYEPRSPEIMAVTGETRVAGPDKSAPGGTVPLWPSVADQADRRVPVVFSGTGVIRQDEELEGVSLADVPETIASIIGLRRPHRDVRSGTAIEEIVSGERPRLVLEVVWKEVGSATLGDSAPNLQDLWDAGAGTTDAVVGSLPIEAAAVQATIGTGGLPSDHGVVGPLVAAETRLTYTDGGKPSNERDLVPVWSQDAPPSVIATLPDHLDEVMNQTPKIGLVGTDSSDRGLIGGNWYPEGDQDAVILEKSGTIARQVGRVREMLRRGGFGEDATTDFLAVSSTGPVEKLDKALGRLVSSARRASGGSAMIVVTATGSDTSPSDGGGARSITAGSLRRRLIARIDTKEPVIEAMVPGGTYLDSDALERLALSDDVVVRELLDLQQRSRPVVVDAFPSIAVTFGKYC